MPTTMSERQRILSETVAARDRAEKLLRGLVDARWRTEQHLERLGKPDAMRKVTGRSAMDNAIASTQRMIESLNRALEQLKRGLSDEDLAEIQAEIQVDLHPDLGAQTPDAGPPDANGHQGDNGLSYRNGSNH